MERLINLCFPKGIYCISCGAILEPGTKYSLCGSCTRRLRFANRNLCKKCGCIMPENMTSDVCGECRQGRYFERAFSCLYYGEYERELILSYKYGGKSYMGEHFSELMYDRLSAEFMNEGITDNQDSYAVKPQNFSELFDMVVPVPVYEKNLFKRGYNQSYLLAKPLARKMGILLSDCLVKLKHVKPMNRLSREERRENVSGSFAVKDNADLKGKVVLLVDDIFTTGSTADECSKVLLDAGAEAVYCIFLASGMAARNGL